MVALQAATVAMETGLLHIQPVVVAVVVAVAVVVVVVDNKNKNTSVVCV